jgi:hypothetical protein
VSVSVNGPSQEKGKLFREGVILSSVLVGLIILAIRPFGFRAFVNGLGHDNVFSFLLVVSVIAVVLAMMQRIGLIFSNEVERQAHV